jgi:5,10-methylenetetrahydromethanopterin reductase
MAELGFLLDGFPPAPAITAQAQAAEVGGAQTLWIACHLFQREPATLAAIALSATKRIRVGLMAISPYAVHPVFAAMAAATLAELFPGRVVLSLGVGAPADLKGAGIASPRPLRTMREALEICRALVAGQAVEYAGEVFEIEGRRLINGGKAMPVLLAAAGPQMLALAGAAADGVIISGGTSVPFVRWCLDQVDRAASSSGGRACRKVGIVYGHIAQLESDALQRSRRVLGFILRGEHHARNLDMAGLKLDQVALREACAGNDWQSVESLIADDIVRGHTISGTAAQARTRLAAYRSIGLDEIVIAGPTEPSDIRNTLEQLGQK